MLGRTYLLTMATLPSHARYTRNTLLAINATMDKRFNRVNPSIYQQITLLNICGVKKTAKDSRGFLRGVKPIRTHICDRPYGYGKGSRTNGINRSNLTTIPIDSRSSEIMVFNTRSAMANPLLLNEFISDHTSDIISLTETWIQPGDAAKVNEMSPEGYTFHGKSRQSRGGGV